MKKTSYQTSGILFPLLLLVIIVAATTYLPDLHETYRATEGTILNLENDLTTKKSEHELLRNELQKFEELSVEQQNEVLKKVAPIFDQKEIINSLEEMRVNTGISLLTTSFSVNPSTIENTNIKEASVLINIVASDPSQVIALLSQIEQQMRLYKVTGLSFSYGNDLVKADITLSTFFKENA